MAFANGYGVDGKSEGNGNGFKMGGSSISGHHKLINSVAWGNKAKGLVKTETELYAQYPSHASAWAGEWEELALNPEL